MINCYDRLGSSSAHIPPGRDGLFELIRTMPDTFKHETEHLIGEGDFVFVRGRFTGHGQPKPWIVVDTVRIEDGRLKEHWDVVEDEASRPESISGLPMYGNSFKMSVWGLRPLGGH